jgi:hypothetical protein
MDTIEILIKEKSATEWGWCTTYPWLAMEDKVYALGSDNKDMVVRALPPVFERPRLAPVDPSNKYLRMSYILATPWDYVVKVAIKYKEPMLPSTYDRLGNERLRHDRERYHMERYDRVRNERLRYGREGDERILRNDGVRYHWNG